jgi:ATP-dependent DNA helicase RecG
MHVTYIDTVNNPDDTVKLRSDTVNDTLFNLIKKNKKITAIEISEQLKVSLSTVKRKIKILKERGQIERVGSDKTGYWKTIETQNTNPRNQ